ncbi:glucose-methanol-choline gmc oxidoreductase [Holotrichia oblita]|uniref:Glucose-methanol-choline gmc oxidoreductase n=1 Tax=Holotrichia oblita TaxID=644536 RepID=A0ACB9SMP4_HOLOL|nr:glucose-methanol-choline gmc oxidoreductase [Holotrichia oblita]
MFTVVKYFSLAAFFVGLFGFTFYAYLCNFCDKLYAYIENIHYKLDKEYDYIVVNDEKICENNNKTNRFFYLIITNVLQMYLKLARKYLNEMSSYTERLDLFLFFLIVGAGTAGSVIASRLAEDPNVTVLVLEAGGFGCSLLDIPAIAPLLHGTIFDWQYKTLPQNYACGAFENNVFIVNKSYFIDEITFIFNQVIPWPTGKLIGGTGRLNNMMYTRGHPEDYKSWYKDLEGFDYDRDVLTYFKKSENQAGIYLNDSKYHSSNGPLMANDLVFVSELYEAVVRTASDMGFPVRDLNSRFPTGFSQPQVNVKGGSRYSTGHHLLQQYYKPNLSIKTFSYVEKIIFKDDYEAYAVKHRLFNKIHVTKARKAVILSGGVIGSAKLLMLSGIGDETHLTDVNIRPIKNLPVGDNLQDHVSTGFDLILIDQPLSVSFYGLSSFINILQYFLQSQGPLTTVGCDAFAILNSNCLNDTIKYQQCEEKYSQPDLELIFMPLGISADNGLHFKNVINLRKNIWDEYFRKISDDYPLNILPILLHPKSVGNIRLRDGAPSSLPMINPNYLSDESDVETLVKGIKFIKEFIEAPAFLNLGIKFNKIPFPGCSHIEFGSDDYWRCYIRQVSFTLYHPVGTCRMGEKDKPENVVDYDFKVIGMNKLFVADASVMPSLVSANINAAVVMLAEKAADIIKNYSRLNSGFCHVREIFLKITICTVLS